MALSIIAKNVTASAINLSDLGFSIAANSQRSIYPEFNLNEIASSTVLKSYIASGSIVINDGIRDLSPDAGRRHTSIESVWYDEQGLEDNVSWDIAVKDQVDPTGFVDRTTTTLSFNSGTRTFTISPTGTNFVYYITGTKITSTAKSCVIPNTMGTHYIYLDSTSLVSTQTYSLDLLTKYAKTGTVYWDSTAGTSISICDERHGINMPGYVHYALHGSVGPTYNSGASLTTFTLGGGSSNASAQFSCSNSSFFDEDIIYNISNNSPQQLSPNIVCPIYYRTGPGSGRWAIKTPNAYPLIYSGTAGYTGANGRIPYNSNTGGTWGLTQIPEDNFVTVFYFLTNDITNPIIGVQGQNVYPTLYAARFGISMEIAARVGGGLPYREFVAIAAVIFQSNSTWTNVPKAVISQLEPGIWYYDLRTVKIQTTQSFSLQQVSVIQLQETTGSQSISAATPSPISFATENFIDNSVFSHSGSQVNIIRGGTYRLSYRVVAAGSGGKCSCQCRLRMDGTTYLPPSGSYAYFDSAGGSMGVIYATFIFTLNAGQYLEILANKSGGSGTASTVQNESIFLVELVGSNT